MVVSFFLEVFKHRLDGILSDVLWNISLANERLA